MYQTHIGYKVGAQTAVGEIDKTKKSRNRGMDVLKCRVDYYSGIVRSTDHEMTTTEKTVCYS